MSGKSLKFSALLQKSLHVLFIMSMFLSTSMLGVVKAVAIPQTGLTTFYNEIQTETTTSLPSLDVFVENVINGKADQIVGVYEEDLFAQRVIQQPANDPAYVSSFENQITQFNMVSTMTGNLGLLAHNYLSGKYFFEMEVGKPVMVVFGDGTVEEFIVDEILSYQALSPHDVYSDFVDLDTGNKLSATQLFEQVYGGDYHLTLQTCIRNGDEFSWGRLFVIATPVDSH